MIENLGFSYNEQEKVLNGLSCTMPQGKVSVICGPSGAGKSTLVKLLLGLYPVQEGEIHIGDQTYAEIGLQQLRASCGYVPQSIYLFRDTIEMNIRCSNECATFDEVMKAAKIAGAHEFIMQRPAGYQTVVEEHGTNFSGGEKQRLAIARIVLKDAGVIILDEATNAIDLGRESEVHDCLRSQAQSGKTVIIIAHRESALTLADNVIRIV
ncbi:MAG: ATP-binding cassette domain-containing protein [Bacillota bacterium]